MRVRTLTPHRHDGTPRAVGDVYDLEPAERVQAAVARGLVEPVTDAERPAPETRPAPAAPITRPAPTKPRTRRGR